MESIYLILDRNLFKNDKFKFSKYDPQMWNRKLN